MDPIATPDQPIARKSYSHLIIILGVLSVTVLPVVAPVAWYMGRSTLRDMDLGLLDPADKKLVKSGTLLGIVGTWLMVVAVVLFVVFVFIVGAPLMQIIQNLSGHD